MGPAHPCMFQLGVPRTQGPNFSSAGPFLRALFLACNFEREEIMSSPRQTAGLLTPCSNSVDLPSSTQVFLMQPTGVQAPTVGPLHRSGGVSL